ncbi:hypothetical protein M3Y96_00169100 [Aphelenchoides besseyi]|nr:hypothetical protein M3Y96_00169100 [Aphelenchoides besseyi]
MYFAILLILSVVTMTSAVTSNRNFFLAPFKEHFFYGRQPADEFVVDQQLLKTVADAVRDYKNDLKFAPAPELKHKRQYHNSFDVLAGGGLGRR